MVLLVLINQKENEIENLEEIVSDGGTTLKEVDNKKKLLDDAIENAKTMVLGV